MLIYHNAVPRKVSYQKLFQSWGIVDVQSRKSFANTVVSLDSSSRRNFGGHLQRKRSLAFQEGKILQGLAHRRCLLGTCVCFCCKYGGKRSKSCSRSRWGPGCWKWKISGNWRRINGFLRNIKKNIGVP